MNIETWKVLLIIFLGKIGALTGLEHGFASIVDCSTTKQLVFAVKKWLRYWTPGPDKFQASIAALMRVDSSKHVSAFEI